MGVWTSGVRKKMNEGHEVAGAVRVKQDANTVADEQKKKLRDGLMLNPRLVQKR